MAPKKKADLPVKFVAEWTLPAAATLGSSVRAHGILLQVRSKLPPAVKKSLTVVVGTLALKMLEGQEPVFRSASATVQRTLQDIENLPVIPREIEDILTIKTSERHRWLKDGRLPSAGTRTVKLRGRARKITFHVFDPRRVEEILDRDLVATWREEDALTAAENRRKAAWKAKLARAEKTAQKAQPAPSSNPEDQDGHKLAGWAEFEREGLLR
ncbi:hypothetical protein [Devosia riboflavina]